jgi:osmotically-inducible protein OsmY
MAKTKEVRAAVQAELADDPLVEAGGISVLTISGDITLSGTVPSYPQYLEAVDAAWRIAGVTSVRNHLEVALPPENQRDDDRLATEANNALAASAAGLERVKANAKNGNLRLTGTVKYRRQRAAAESAVIGLPGVRNVEDHVELGFEVDPAEVNRLVSQALDRHQVLPDDTHVTADIRGNTVVLVGHVQTSAQRDAVEAAAWLAQGVMVVIDEIEITG